MNRNQKGRTQSDLLRTKPNLQRREMSSRKVYEDKLEFESAQNVLKTVYEDKAESESCPHFFSI
ncbi:hypothetical protein SAMN05421736_11662 [Evansella caseinilytica]|uniref:Uncharacterized protein n=1 Tax=Evansella caseinilytica TaxID=1503961 RepID=A0A1H3TVY2_9BACI|nr:hypothetical protein SAMN05421736_11662 [Evansella caseinilytica]